MIDKPTYEELESQINEFKLLFETINESIYSTNQGHLTNVNNAFCKLFGYTKDELIGMPTWNLAKSDLQENVKQSFIQKLQSRNTAPVETICMRKNGETFLAEISISFINDATRNFGIIRDISEKIQKEKELINAKEKAEESEKKFKIYTQYSPIAIYTTDEKGDCIYANSKWLEFAGLTLEESLGKGWSKALHPDDKDLVYENWYKSVQSNGNWSFEYRFITPQGNVTYVEGSAKALYNKENKLIGYLGSNVDITKRKKAEKQFHLVVQSVPNAIILVNSQGEITMTNKQTEKQFGYTNEELIGNKLEILIPEKYKINHPNFRNMFFANLQARPMGIGRDLFALRKDGTEFPAEIGLNPISTPDGILVLASIIDITERKKLEENIKENSKKIEEQNVELKQSEQKLKELNTTKDKLFSIIGHDLRGPIGSFKSLIELMLSGYDLSDTKSLIDILQVIQKTANSTYDLLENLLAWAKSQRNEIVFTPEKIVLKEIILHTIDLFTELTQNKQIQIIDYTPVNTIVFADKNMLMTILRNLISNAIKFTLNGKQIHIFTNKNENDYLLTIKDEGIGIKSDDLPKLFQNTTNFTTYGTNGEKGSGLGLLLCKDFVEKKRGKIWVESEVGKGSDFKFTLPLCND